MHRKKGIVYATLGLVVLLTSIVLSAPGKGNASPPPMDRDVRVVNTTAEAVPVAVQGSVNLTGTPSVAVSGPVQTRDLDHGARQPFSRRVSASIAPGENFASGMEFSVPAGKVLVIESISFKVETQLGQHVRVAFAAWSGGVATDYFVPLIASEFDGFLRHQAAQSFKVYADPSRPVWALVALDSPANGAAAWFSVAGYLVDAP